MKASPSNLDPLFAVEFVGVEKLAMLDAVFVYELGHLHIKAAVLGDLHESFLSPPLNGIDPIRRFADSESRLGDVVQFRLASRQLLNLDEEVQCSELKRQIEDGVTHQNFVIEIDDIESNDEVRTKQLLNQIVNSVLRIDPILGQIRAIGDPKRHAHVPFFLPTAYVVRCALSFQIEVNNVHPGASFRFELGAAFE